MDAKIALSAGYRAREAPMKSDTIDSTGRERDWNQNKQHTQHLRLGLVENVPLPTIDRDQGLERGPLV